jgi:adenosylhomocysteinase
MSRAIVCNSGHFNVEIDLAGFGQDVENVAWRKSRRGIYVAFRKKINVLADGRLINLSAAEGHPAMVMDMSFANQLLSCEFIVQNYKKLAKDVFSLPAKLDYNVATLKPSQWASSTSLPLNRRISFQLEDGDVGTSHLS